MGSGQQAMPVGERGDEAVELGLEEAFSYSASRQDSEQ